MGRVALRRLTIKNFRSFEGEHVIEFDDNGLYLIKGNNLDTRGESASGKSTLFHAIAFALDFAPYSAGEYHCWFNEDPMFVELELHTDNGPAIIHRGDKLWMNYEGKKITSSKAVGEKIDRVCGMNKKLREAITYRRQRSFGLFLSKKDSEKKAFLVELLGLHWLEEAIDAAVTSVSEARKLVDAIRPTVELHQKLTQEASQRVPELRVLPTDEAVALLLVAQSSVNRTRALRAAAQTQLNQILEEERKSITPFEFDDTNIINLSRTLDQCRVRIQRLGQPELAKQRHERDIGRIHTEIRTLFDEKCPRCNRTWDQAQEEMERNQECIRKIENDLAEAEKQIEVLNKLREVEKAIKSQLQEAREAEAVAERAHSEKIRKISSDPNRKSLEKKRQIDEIDEALQSEVDQQNRAAAELSNIKHRNETVQKLYDQATAALEAAGVHRVAAEQQLEAAEATFNSERDYLDLLRGFLGQIFAEILNEISDETNRILASLPNAAKVTIKFETDRLTQDDKLRNEITPVASFGGRKWPLESGSSGGMFTSVELAVDLAICNVISARTGVDLGWMILDEAFANGSDKVTKEGCLEILKQYSEKKLIIVVEHASEFKELFSRVIEIELNNERSRIV